MFCNNLSTGYKKLLKQLDSAIVKYLPQINEVVLHVKFAVDSRFAKSLVDLTPNTWDNVLREQMASYLETALKEFAVVRKNVNPDGTLNVPGLMTDLAALFGADKDAFYQKLSALMLKYLHAGKLKQSVYDFYTQGDYTVSKLS